MSSIDIWIRDLIAKYAVILAGIFLLMFWISRKWIKFREKLFQSHLLGFETECAELATQHKRRLFGSLESAVSNDEFLRSLGRIRILEIGVKTGNNIQFYPEGTHLIGVDWNRKLGEYLINGERSWEFAHVFLERLIIGDGTSLKGIPSGYVDAVVTTRALCSTSSPSVTLSEIHRILAPGGKYFFMEHIPEKEGTFTRWLQAILSKTGIWPSLFGDCRLDSNPIRDIEKAGFEEVSWKFITLQGYVAQSYHLILSRQHIIGTAVR